MIFRRPKSYSVTLQRAHALLGIPRSGGQSSTSPLVVGGSSASRGAGGSVVEKPSREQIQEAFRAAARRHHPDVVAGASAAPINKAGANAAFRECADARELLLDYYVRRTYVPKQVIESTKDRPPPQDDSLFSVWTTDRSFQIEAFLRLSVCLGLAVGSYYHDLHLPEKRKQQIRRRDEGFHQFGPQP